MRSAKARVRMYYYGFRGFRGLGVLDFSLGWIRIAYIPLPYLGVGCHYTESRLAQSSDPSPLAESLTGFTHATCKGRGARGATPPIRITAPLFGEMS